LAGAADQANPSERHPEPTLVDLGRGLDRELWADVAQRRVSATVSTGCGRSTLEVLRRLVAGGTKREIAAELVISPSSGRGEPEVPPCRRGLPHKSPRDVQARFAATDVPQRHRRSR
jgi:hypothetical protein